MINQYYYSYLDLIKRYKDLREFVAIQRQKAGQLEQQITNEKLSVTGDFGMSMSKVKNQKLDGLEKQKKGFQTQAEIAAFIIHIAGNYIINELIPYINNLDREKSIGLISILAQDYIDQYDSQIFFWEKIAGLFATKEQVDKIFSQVGEFENLLNKELSQLEKEEKQQEQPPEPQPNPEEQMYGGDV